MSVIIMGSVCSWCNLKGIVHPKMKISPRFTHPQGILGMSDIPLSDNTFRVLYIPHCPVCSNLYTAVNGACFWIWKKVSIITKLLHTAPELSFISTPEPCGVVLWWMDTSFSETGAPFTAVIQIGTDRTMWNITLNGSSERRNVRHA